MALFSGAFFPCCPACPLASFQWALQAVIHPWSWELVHLPPPFTSLEAASAGAPAVCDIARVNLQLELGWAGSLCLAESICQLTPCSGSPRHVLAAGSTALQLAWQDVPGNELWHLTLLPLTGCSPRPFHHLGQPCPAPLLIPEVLEEPALSSSGIQGRWGQPSPATPSMPGAAIQSWDKPQMSLFPPSKGRDQHQNLGICSHAGGWKAEPTRQKFYFCTPSISPVLAATGICWCLWFFCYKQAVAMGTLLLIKAQMYCQEENGSNISSAGQQLCSMCWNVGGILSWVRGREQEQQGLS